MTAQLSVDYQPVTVNLLGVIEHPEFGDSPYRVDADGVPYIPVGDGGIVLGLRLGDSVFAAHADHAAPGACLMHTEPAARHALVLYSCIGNPALVRTGAAAGVNGAVIGKRGEAGRVVVGFLPDDLAQMRPGDQVSVRSRGQGFRPRWLPGDVTVMNTDPDLLPRLPITAEGSGDGQVIDVSVRSVLPSSLAGNGIGRPAAGWDLDLQVAPGSGYEAEAPLLLGDLVAVADIDARFNMGYRKDWVTIGVVVHGSSPLPGHGPGMAPILTGPRRALRARPDGNGHTGLTAKMLGLQ